MSPIISTDLMPGARFPRVSGDEPPYSYPPNHKPAFSPRERG